MIRIASASLASLLLMTILSGSSSADCAWVLWAYTGTGSSVNWHPVNSYERLDGCKLSIEAMRAASSASERANVSHACLPDSINPMVEKRKP